MLNTHHQKGVMLLEALIGVLLFSIGIIAMMGLQANALATAGETKYRSEASFIAEEFISDMRNDNAFASSLETTPPLFVAATAANTSPYTLTANAPLTRETSAPAAPAGTADVITKTSYLTSKTAYTKNKFFYATQKLPSGSVYPPIVTVTSCLRTGWTAASLCPAPVAGAIGTELYGAVIEIEMKWKMPTASPTAAPRRYSTVAYVMLESTP